MDGKGPSFTRAVNPSPARTPAGRSFVALPTLRQSVMKPEQAPHSPLSFARLLTEPANPSNLFRRRAKPTCPSVPRLRACNVLRVASQLLLFRADEVARNGASRKILRPEVFPNAPLQFPAKYIPRLTLRRLCLSRLLLGRASGLSAPVSGGAPPGSKRSKSTEPERSLILPQPSSWLIAHSS
jgi:hypothetical protein